MTILGHITIPLFLYINYSNFTGNEIEIIKVATLVTSSVLPDLDIFYQLFTNKSKIKNNFRHHKWFTHWPIFYLPFLFLSLFIDSEFLKIMVFGIYSHLILDSFSAGDGIMWLFPFSKKFTNFFSSQTNGHHGKEWLEIYTKTPTFKLEILFALLMAIQIILSPTFSN